MTSKKSSEELDQLYKRDCGVCWICHRVVDREIATRDHLIPRSKGGPDNIRNYAIACAPCNNSRGSKDMISDKQVRDIVLKCQLGKCFGCDEKKPLVNFGKVSSFVGSRKVLRGFCAGCRVQSGNVPQQRNSSGRMIDPTKIQKGQKIKFNIGSIHCGRVVTVKYDGRGPVFVVFEGSKKFLTVPVRAKVQVIA